MVAALAELKLSLAAGGGSTACGGAGDLPASAGIQAGMAGAAGGAAAEAGAPAGVTAGPAEGTPGLMVNSATGASGGASTGGSWKCSTGEGSAGAATCHTDSDCVNGSRNGSGDSAAAAPIFQEAVSTRPQATA